MDRGGWQAAVDGVARVRHDLATKLLPLLDHRRSREFQKNIYFCFIEYTKAFDCVENSQQTVENS